jgi:hypothetical protein
VWKGHVSKEYGIQVIPTQIFYDATGKERFRHEGFYSKEDILAKWKEFGVDLSDPSAAAPAFERLAPARPDERPKESICYMWMVTSSQGPRDRPDGKGSVRLCPHCYWIMYSFDRVSVSRRVTVTDDAGTSAAFRTAFLR